MSDVSAQKLHEISENASEEFLRHDLHCHLCRNHMNLCARGQQLRAYADEAEDVFWYEWKHQGFPPLTQIDIDEDTNG